MKLHYLMQQHCSQLQSVSKAVTFKVPLFLIPYVKIPLYPYPFAPSLKQTSLIHCFFLNLREFLLVCLVLISFIISLIQVVVFLISLILFPIQVAQLIRASYLELVLLHYPRHRIRHHPPSSLQQVLNAYLIMMILQNSFTQESLVVHQPDYLLQNVCSTVFMVVVLQKTYHRDHFLIQKQNCLLELLRVHFYLCMYQTRHNQRYQLQNFRYFHDAYDGVCCVYLVLWQ